MIKICWAPEVSDFITVKRTWRERLLSWPWCPWVTHKKTPRAIAYSLADGSIVVSRATYRKIVLEAEKNDPVIKIGYDS